MTVSAEGRVENQKLNQTAALLSFGLVFGFQLDSLEENLTTLPGFTFIQFGDQPKSRNTPKADLSSPKRIPKHFLHNFKKSAENDFLEPKICQKLTLEIANTSKFFEQKI